MRSTPRPRKSWAEPPAAAYNDLYGAITAVCGEPPYNTPYYPNAPNRSISDYKGVHCHDGGWQILANATATAVKALPLGRAPEGATAAATAAAAPGDAIVCKAPVLLAAAWGLHPDADTVAVEGHDFDAKLWMLPKSS